MRERVGVWRGWGVQTIKAKEEGVEVIVRCVQVSAFVNSKLSLIMTQENARR
jgi:hypothetical protein